MEILDNRNNILSNLDSLFEEFQSLKNAHSKENKMFADEIQRVNEFNSRLTFELREKDKKMFICSKTIVDINYSSE